MNLRDIGLRRYWPGVSAAFALLMVMGESHAQMSMPGQFSVGESGAASYTVPIQTPPGIGGVEPRIALSYSSGGSNGIQGVGWSLTGLSTIIRCPRTLSQDGVRGSVSYNANDRFCMDGQRLLLVSGTYGTNGAEYRLERDNFTRIISYAETGATNGPGSFIVKTRDGQTMEFGKTADSRIEALTKTDVAVWAINKVSDTRGNYYTVTYDEDTTNGQYYPLRINYTGNSNAAVSGTNRIDFTYQGTRPDPTTTYAAGSQYKTTRLLKAITTVTDGSNVATYTLAYEVSPGTQRSRVTSITVCAANGQCLPAIGAKYASELVGTLGTQGFTSSGDTCLKTCGQWLGVDVNGDGKEDLIHVTTTAGKLFTWISNGDGTFNKIAFTSTVDTCTATSGCGTWQTIDLNGDGLTDLLHFVNDSGKTYQWINNGDGTYAVTLQTVTGDTCLISCGFFSAMDVNGDGLTDLVHVTNNGGNIITWFSNGNGTFNRVTFTATADTCLTCGQWQVADVNGDGYADLIHLLDDSGNIKIWKADGTGSYTIQAYNYPADTCLLSCGSWVMADINGDGQSDLVHLTNKAGGVNTWFSKGDGTFVVKTFTSTVDTCITGCGSWQSMDLNGDGQTDFVHLVNDAGQIYKWSSLGDGTFTVVSETKSGDTCLTTCGAWITGDFNAEGVADMLHLVNDTGSYYVWSTPRLSRDIPQSVGDALGAVSFSMDTLSRLLGNGYYKELAASGTLRPTVFPQLVVTESRSADGAGGTQVTNYSYGTSMVDRNPSGRGFLGFHWTQTKDQASGLITRTYYRQDWPYLGAIDKIGKGTGVNGAWSDLGLTTYQYACTATDGAGISAACSGATVKPGSRYVVYPSQFDEQAWDWDGATTFIALPIKRTTQQQDAWGNVTNLKVETLTPSAQATGYSQTTVNTFAPADTTNWFLGRLLKSTVTATSP